MYYTPGQLRDTVGLSKEAFRHWKRVVPAFANGRGHAPSFSSGDVLASAVLKRLTYIIGVRIGHLSEVASSIFQICNASTWETLQNKSLVIDLEEHTCLAVSGPARPTGELVVVCALGPIIKTLQFDLIDSSVQGHSRPSISTARVEKGGKQ